MCEIIEVLYQYNQKISIRNIARSLNLSRNTIKKYIQTATSLDINILEAKSEELSVIATKITSVLNISSNGKKTSLSTQQLKPLDNVIKELMNERYITFRQIWKLLQEQYQITISETSLIRYIHKHFEPMKAQPVIVMPTIPGIQAQVDFTSVGLLFCPIQKKMRKAYAFMMILSHSRMRFIYFVFKQDSATWIDCHIRAFDFFGGVPKSILLDNLKSGVIKPDIYDPTINRAYAECERYYGFVADPAKVRTPKHKGKVERTGTIVKQQIIAGRKHEDIMRANEFALSWCRNDIAQVICKATGEKPYTRFIRDEKDKLLSLPEEPFEIPIWQSVTVHTDSHVTFQGSFYSVPVGYINQIIFIRALQRVVQLYDSKSVLIKTHIRASFKGQWLTDWQDIPTSKREYVLQTKEQVITLAAELGESVQQLVTIWSTPQFTETVKRKVNALLKLAEEFSSQRLEAACKRALIYDNFNIKSIKRILEQNLDVLDINLTIPHQNKDKLYGIYIRDPKHFSIH